MTTTTAGFCEALVQSCPELRGILDEHISDYDELLPNVFLGDVTRYLLANGEGRVRIVEYLNKSFLSEVPDVENLIAVSFVENLESRDELERVIEGADASQIVTEWDRQKSV